MSGNSKDRRKGNQQPISSAKAASLLEGTGVRTQASGLVGFDAFSNNVAATNNSTELDTHYQPLIQKLTKKDTTTQLKSLVCLYELVQEEKDVQQLATLLQCTARLYPALSQTANSRVRQASHRLIALLCARAGKAGQKHSVQVLPFWLLACDDQVPDVSSCAEQLLTDTFSGADKQLAVYSVSIRPLLQLCADIVLCRDNYSQANLLVRWLLLVLMGKKACGDGSEEDEKGRGSRLLTAALSCLARLTHLAHDNTTLYNTLQETLLELLWGTNAAWKAICNTQQAVHLKSIVSLRDFSQQLLVISQEGLYGATAQVAPSCLATVVYLTDTTEQYTYPVQWLQAALQGLKTNANVPLMSAICDVAQFACKSAQEHDQPEQMSQIENVCVQCACVMVYSSTTPMDASFVSVLSSLSRVPCVNNLMGSLADGSLSLTETGLARMCLLIQRADWLDTDGQWLNVLYETVTNQECAHLYSSVSKVLEDVWPIYYNKCPAAKDLCERVMQHYKVLVTQYMAGTHTISHIQSAFPLLVVCFLTVDDQVSQAHAFIQTQALDTALLMLQECVRLFECNVQHRDRIVSMMEALCTKIHADAQVTSVVPVLHQFWLTLHKLMHLFTTDFDGSGALFESVIRMVQLVQSDHITNESLQPVIEVLLESYNRGQDVVFSDVLMDRVLELVLESRLAEAIQQLAHIGHIRQLVMLRIQRAFVHDTMAVDELRWLMTQLLMGNGESKQSVSYYDQMLPSADQLRATLAKWHTLLVPVFVLNGALPVSLMTTTTLCEPIPSSDVAAILQHTYGLAERALIVLAKGVPFEEKAKATPLIVALMTSLCVHQLLLAIEHAAVRHCIDTAQLHETHTVCMQQCTALIADLLDDTVHLLDTVLNAEYWMALRVLYKQQDTVVCKRHLVHVHSQHTQFAVACAVIGVSGPVLQSQSAMDTDYSEWTCAEWTKALNATSTVQCDAHAQTLMLTHYIQSAISHLDLNPVLVDLSVKTHAEQLTVTLSAMRTYSNLLHSQSLDSALFEHVCCNLVNWLQMCAQWESSFLYSNQGVLCFVLSTVRLCVSVSECVQRNQETNPDQYSEWSEFFVTGCAEQLLPLLLHLTAVPVHESNVCIDWLLSELCTCVNGHITPYVSPVSIALPVLLHPNMDEKKYSNALQSFIMHVSPLLAHENWIVRQTAHAMLKRSMEDIYKAECANWAAVDDDNVHERTVYFVPDFIMSTVSECHDHLALATAANTHLEWMDQSALSAQCCHYLLLHDLLFDYYTLVPVNRRAALVEYVRSQNLLTDLLPCLFVLMPETNQQFHALVKHMQYDTVALLFTKKHSIHTNLAEHHTWFVQSMACALYLRAIMQVPALTRHWYNSVHKSLAEIVNKVTVSYVSPLVCAAEWEAFNKEDSADRLGDLKVNTRPSVREVCAQYVMDEVNMQIMIKLPDNYPLAQPVLDTKHVAASKDKQRRWQMRLVVLLTHQNGGVLDALCMWKSNLDKHLAGAEDCAVCMSTVHAQSMQLPKVACKQCKHRFHADCLYTWFNTSNQATCPLCRTAF